MPQNNDNPRMGVDTTLHASPHRIATLSSCVHPQTVLGLRSFIGAYKVLGRVIPQCSKVLAPLESCIVGRKSQDVLHWSDNTREAFRVAQNTLSTNRSITLPRPSDQLHGLLQTVPSPNVA